MHGTCTTCIHWKPNVIETELNKKYTFLGESLLKNHWLIQRSVLR